MASKTMETGEVNKTLESRGEAYGDYGVGTAEFGKIMASLKTIYMAKTGYPPSEAEFLPIFYIVMKLVRIAATPNHIDSWHDIQGYAKLAEDMYKKRS